MSEFEDRLKAAIDRGIRRGQKANEESAQMQATVEQLKGQHTQIRLALSEYIEGVMKKLADHFPGFRFERVFGENGWGGACWRDDLVFDNGQRRSRYSRFEMVIRPFNEFYVVDLQARGTIANREVFSRGNYQPIAEAAPDHFRQLIDSWSLSFAELYAAKS
jgi:hypothetical protein